MGTKKSHIRKMVGGCCEEASTAVKMEEGLSDWFNVKVGLHQGSALSPLLFIIVMDVITKKVKGGLPWELLYADDLVLMADDETELKKMLKSWKDTLEEKGLKVNLGKTNVMWGGEVQQSENNPKYLCAVCRKWVGRNSILCGKCSKWTHI